VIQSTVLLLLLLLLCAVGKLKNKKEIKKRAQVRLGRTPYLGWLPTSSSACLLPMLVEVMSRHMPLACTPRLPRPVLRVRTT
jgi:hypothetical protein